jgi:hypothetical protein
MKRISLSLDKFPRVSPMIIGLIFGIIILLRNITLILLFSYTFLPDSNSYIHLGKDFFHTFYISPLYTFPYPLLNALSNSYKSPYFLLSIQVLIAAAAAGFFVYILAKRSRLSAVLMGLLLSFDLVGGAFSRSIMTDSIFSSLILICLGILLDHFDRRYTTGLPEMFVSGLVYGLTLNFRPSNIYLAVLLVPLYIFLVPSWKKLLLLFSGGAAIFLAAGLINLLGSGSFYFISTHDSHTSTYTAYPLFVYKLFSPENGPKSLQLNQYLSNCYPGVDFLSKVDRSVGGSFDSMNNVNLILGEIVPCVTNAAKDPAIAQSIFPQAYMESMLHDPIRFALIMVQENAVFFGYNDPYILGWYLDARKNNACESIPWCSEIQVSRRVWDDQSWYSSLYEKVDTKLVQVYLVPVGLISALSPDKNYLPYNIAWFGMIVVLILVTRGRERFLAIATFVVLQYTCITVVVGLGFTERYAAMMVPLQIVLSGLLFTVVIRKAYQVLILHQPIFKSKRDFRR